MAHRLLAHARSNAIAYVALFVALGGTALAASSALPRNSVGTRQLRNRAVTGKKVAPHTLTGANVAKATLTGANVAKGSLTGANLAKATLTGANVAKASLTGTNIRSSTLGTVPNAGHLGGLSAAKFQRAITGNCASTQAIGAISSLGKVSCRLVGAITGVTAGTGLTGGGSAGNLSLAVDPTVVQARVAAACGAGHAIFSIRQDGTVGCHSTDVTQMMGGTGTATLSPTSDYLVPVGVSTPSARRLPSEVGSADLPSVARHLFVQVATAPATGASWKFDFFVDGQERTGLACVITGPAHSCQSGGSVSIPRGARVALHAAGTNITAGTTATFGWTDTTY